MSWLSNFWGWETIWEDEAEEGWKIHWKCGITKKRPDGLQWRQAGRGTPDDGIEIENDKLQEALQAKADSKNSKSEVLLKLDKW